MTLQADWHFQSVIGRGRGYVRDRRDVDNRIAIGIARGDDDGARSILAPFFCAGAVLVVPEIRVAYHQARLGDWDRHAWLA